MAANEPLPGTSDLWIPEIHEWHLLENAAHKIFPRYGYNELRTPIIERTDVFVKGLGDETEVVQKEMYTFNDRGGRSLTLRPEGTAGVMRAIAYHGLNQGEEARVYYIGPMFRGERPAKGRKRQFHQIGVESVGKISPLQDAETIAMLVHYLKEVGINDAKVKINSRGTAADRPAVDNALKAYFKTHVHEMCEDCQRRVDSNVWRILDCKNEQCQAVIDHAPHIIDLLGESSQTYIKTVCDYLDALGVNYEISHRLVRGLDYYEHTIFELSHYGLGAQDALAGGGRYKISLSGSKSPIEGVGFACGMERLLLAREALELKNDQDTSIQVFVVGLGNDGLKQACVFAKQFRNAGLRVLSETQERSMKAQMRTANALKVKFTVIVGESEIANQVAVVKNMAEGTQQEIPFADLAETLSKLIMI